MKFFRSHITNLVLSVSLWIGIGLYLLHPVQAKQSSDSFASWLNTVLKESRGDDVQKEILRLGDADQNISSLIKEASVLVSKYNDDFDLPLGKKTDDSDFLYDLLLIEWDAYQTGNGMGKASIPNQLKPLMHSNLDKLSSFAGTYAAAESGQLKRAASGTMTVALPHDERRVKPMAGGIAINAP